MDQSTFIRAAGLNPSLAARWSGPVTAAAGEFDIATPTRLAAWIAQMRHESGGFTSLVESFNYKPAALAIFSRVPASMRERLGRQPNQAVVPIDLQRQIANLAYGGRYGNGDAASGDGWRFRGRGLKQITFHDNYASCGRALGVDLLTSHDLLATDDVLAARSARWFWMTIGCKRPAGQKPELVDQASREQLTHHVAAAERQEIGAVLTLKGAYRVGKAAFQRTTVLPVERVGSMRGDVLRYAVEPVGDGAARRIGRHARPVRREYVISEAPQQQVERLREQLLQIPADGVVGIGNDPATEAEFTAGIFLGPTRGLNDPIQTDESGNNERAHPVLPFDEPDRSVNTTNDSRVDRPPSR